MHGRPKPSGDRRSTTSTRSGWFVVLMLGVFVIAILLLYRCSLSDMNGSNAPGSVVVLPEALPSSIGPTPVASEASPSPNELTLGELYLSDNPGASATAVLQDSTGQTWTVLPGAVLPDGTIVEAISSYGIDLVRNGQRWRLAESAEAQLRRRSRPVGAVPPQGNGP